MYAQQPSKRYFIGLDLGPSGEVTALAVLERPLGRAGQPKPPYALRHLHRFPLGTPYPEIVAAVRTLLRTPPLPGSTLVLDRTAVGQPVQRLFEEGLKGQACCTFTPVTITAPVTGSAVVNGRITVAKSELVAVVQVLLQTRRLQVARDLRDTSLLIRELETFRTKPLKLAGIVDEPWREGAQDDLVLAVALAAWMGERCLPESGGVPVVLSE